MQNATSTSPSSSSTQDDELELGDLFADLDAYSLPSLPNNSLDRGFETTSSVGHVNEHEEFMKNVPLPRKLVTKQHVFQLDPEYKKAYSRLTSKRSRDKKRNVLAEMKTRNVELQSANADLYAQLDTLGGEYRTLERSKFNGIDSKTIIENDFLVREVKRQRMLVSEIQRVIAKVNGTSPYSQEQDPDQVKSPYVRGTLIGEEGLRDALFQAENLLSRTNDTSIKWMLPCDETLLQLPSVGRIIKESAYLQKIRDVKVGSAFLPEGCSISTAREVITRSEVCNIVSPASKLARGFLTTYPFTFGNGSTSIEHHPKLARYMAMKKDIHNQLGMEGKINKLMLDLETMTLETKTQVNEMTDPLAEWVEVESSLNASKMLVFEICQSPIPEVIIGKSKPPSEVSRVAIVYYAELADGSFIFVENQFHGTVSQVVTELAPSLHLSALKVIKILPSDADPNKSQCVLAGSTFLQPPGAPNSEQSVTSERARLFYGDAGFENGNLAYSEGFMKVLLNELEYSLQATEQ